MQAEYVGIDLHRRRSVIVRKDAEGEILATIQIDNEAMALAEAVAAAGEHPEVVLEATYGWYWAADVLTELGAHVHLAHPLGNNWGHRRVKNDQRDAEDLIDLLRLGRLAEAYVAPPGMRQLRELQRELLAQGRLPESWIPPAHVLEVRTLARLYVALMNERRAWQQRIHAQAFHQGAPPISGLLSEKGRSELAQLELSPAGHQVVDAALGAIDELSALIVPLRAQLASVGRRQPGARSLTAHYGIGPLCAAVIWTELGDCRRFSGSDQASALPG